MNATIGIWTLVVGGWVLPDYGVTPTQVPDIASEIEMQAPLPVLPGLEREEPLFSGPAGQESPSAGPEGARDESGRPQRPMRQPPAQYGGAQAAPVQREQTIPSAPTDPLLGHPESRFAPPTASGPSTGDSSQFDRTRFGTPSQSSAVQSRYQTGRDAQRRPLAPTYRPDTYRPPAPPTFSRFVEEERGRSRTQLSSSQRPLATFGSPLGSGSKPFSNYEAPPAISPYMRLFSTDDDFGRIDNYYTLVKPRLEQRSQNLQFGGAIGGLKQRTQVQGAAIQQLGRQTDYLQGAQTPQYYMNYGNYFGR